MKKTVSLILLTSFLFITNGCFLYYKYLQYDIRREMQEKVRLTNEKELIRIPVNAENKPHIKWIRKNREFLYRGEMYDVVRTEIHGDKKYIYCLNDYRERELMVRFRKTQRKKERKLWERGRSLANKYIPERFSLDPLLSCSGEIITPYHRQYKSLCFDISPPPPSMFRA